MLNRFNPLHSAQAVSMELFARLQEIAVANGFETDIGLRCFRGRTNVDENTIPCAIVHELDDTQADSAGKRSGYVQIRQSYVLVGYSKCDPDHPNDTVHAMIRDIKRVVFKGADRTFEGKVQEIIYRGREIGVRADGDSSIFAGVRLDITYLEDLSSPGGEQV
jgi:hypothetical protein